MSCELISVLKFLCDLDLKNVVPVNICGNESAIKIALNLVFHDKAKHFEIHVHFIKGKFFKRCY